MSSTTTTMDRRTYWCHHCDMSISLIPPTTPTPLTCPHCNSDFFVELDTPITNHNHHDVYFNNVINHLFTSNTTSIDTPIHTDTENSPASKLAIESITTVKITEQLLGIDPDIMCAVCKDEFVIDDETKELPCNHMYHPDCILPWLSLRNSCPVCRFQLPVEVKVRRRSRSRVLRFGSFMAHEFDNGNGDGDDNDLGFGLGNFARRHRFVFPMRRSQLSVDGDDDDDEEEEGVFSPTQIGEEGGVSGRRESVETVSSWPNWPVDIDGPDIVHADVDVVISS